MLRDFLARELSFPPLLIAVSCLKGRSTTKLLGMPFRRRLLHCRALHEGAGGALWNPRGGREGSAGLAG